MMAQAPPPRPARPSRASVQLSPRRNESAPAPPPRGVRQRSLSLSGHDGRPPPIAPPRPQATLSGNQAIRQLPAIPPRRTGNPSEKAKAPIQSKDTSRPFTSPPPRSNRPYRQSVGSGWGRPAHLRSRCSSVKLTREEVERGSRTDLCPPDARDRSHVRPLPVIPPRKGSTPSPKVAPVETSSRSGEVASPRLRMLSADQSSFSQSVPEVGIRQDQQQAGRHRHRTLPPQSHVSAAGAAAKAGWRTSSGTRSLRSSKQRASVTPISLTNDAPPRPPRRHPGGGIHRRSSVDSISRDTTHHRSTPSPVPPPRHDLQGTEKRIPSGLDDEQHAQEAQKKTTNSQTENHSEALVDDKDVTNNGEETTSKDTMDLPEAAAITTSSVPETSHNNAIPKSTKGMPDPMTRESTALPPPGLMGQEKEEGGDEAEEEESEASKHARHKKAVVDEIVNTERDYVRDLRFVVTQFLTPCRENSILSSKKLITLFGDLEAILGVNEQLLLGLNSCEEKEKSLADVFAENVALFRMYSVYCSNNQSSLDLCEKLISDKKSKFYALHERVRELPECRGLWLVDFLIKPVQRICKYPLLFRELLRHTPENHVEYENISHVQKELVKVAAYVNEYNRKVTNRRKVASIQSSLSGLGKTKLATEHRLFVREGVLALHDPTSLRKVFLFSDLLVVTKGVLLKRNKYQVKHLFFMDSFIQIFDYRDNEVLQHAFELVDMNATEALKYVFIAQDEAEKEVWFQALADVLVSNGCDRPTLGNYRKPKSRRRSTRFDIEQLHRDLLAKNSGSTGDAPSAHMTQTETHSTVAQDLQKGGDEAVKDMGHTHSVDLRQSADRGSSSMGSTVPGRGKSRNWASLRRTSHSSESRVDLLEIRLRDKLAHVEDLRNEVDDLAQQLGHLQEDINSIRSQYGEETIVPILEKCGADRVVGI